MTEDGLSGGYKCHCSLSAAMLRTCKEIYAESSEVLNSGNEFVIEASSDIALRRLEQSRVLAPRDQNLTQSCLLKSLPSSGPRKIRI